MLHLRSCVKENVKYNLFYSTYAVMSCLPRFILVSGYVHIATTASDDRIHTSHYHFQLLQVLAFLHHVSCRVVVSLTE